jgi:hypothetical protein
MKLITENWLILSTTGKIMPYGDLFIMLVNKAKRKSSNFLKEADVM